MKFGPLFLGCLLLVLAACKPRATSPENATAPARAEQIVELIFPYGSEKESWIN